MMKQKPQILMVGGTPRSQTSALSVLLNTHRDMFIGMERYYKKVLTDFSLSGADFAAPRFYELAEGDTFHDRIFPDVDVAPKIERFDRLTYVGDKIPTVYEKIDEIVAAIPTTQFLFIVRDVIDVAASYRDRAAQKDATWPPEKDHIQAVRDWNKANHILASLGKDINARIILARQLFSDVSKAARLYAHLGLDPEACNMDHVAEIYRTASAILARPVQKSFTAAELDYIAQTADFASYHSLLNSPHCVRL